MSGSTATRSGGATVALAVFSMAVALGYARVFPGWGFAVDLGVVVVTGHGTSYVLRRLGVSGWIAVPVTAFVLASVVVWLHYGSTFSMLLPTAETWGLMRVELDLVRSQFASATAPVPYGAGWAMLATTGLAMTVLLADTFAFRAEARAEALVPGGVLFVFIGALGDERLRVGLTAVLVATGYVTVVLLRSLHARPRRAELRAARSPRDNAVFVAVGTALAVALVAGIIGPRMPGAGAEPLYDTRGRSGGVTEVMSPLVDIRARLVNQSSSELFRVDASEESYWRVTTLPEFDGTTFGLPTRSLQRIDGAFGSARADATLIRQDIEVVGLRGQLVPAAADPVEASGGELRLNPDTSTLVNVDGELARGDEFTVVSASPRLQPSVLRGATSDSPPDPIHLDLPDGFPSSVRALAAEITDGTTSTYDAALALQSFFRTEFEYSLDVPAGHGSSAIEVFLRQRIGYCEQFAATFAAMARTLGMPSRVAVGYTAGRVADDGRYSVLGRNAHAWPEVWFDDVGWVPFEPTPGRGAPGAQEYTGVAPEQDTSEPGQPQSGSDDADTPDPSATIPPSAGPDFEDDFSALFPDPTEGQGGGGGATSTETSGRSPLPFLLVLAAILLVSSPAVLRRLTDRRIERAPTHHRVLFAWRRATRSATAAGVRASGSMTPSEWAVATSTVLPLATRPMRSLATTVDAVMYAPPGTVDLDQVGHYGESVTRDCLAWARQVDSIAADTLTIGGRIARYAAFWR